MNDIDTALAAILSAIGRDRARGMPVTMVFVDCEDICGSLARNVAYPCMDRLSALGYSVRLSDRVGHELDVSGEYISIR